MPPSVNLWNRDQWKFIFRPRNILSFSRFPVVFNDGRADKTGFTVTILGFTFFFY